jgi:tetratricopeptide (TPR) repeat protein
MAPIMSSQNRPIAIALCALAALTAFACFSCQSDGSRTTSVSTSSGEAVAPPGSPERHQAFDDAYRQGVSLMAAYLDLPRDKVASNPQSKKDLPAAIASLDVAIGIEPESSTAWWGRGKAFQLLGDHENAYESFHHSYKIDEGKNPDAGVQLLLECLETGRGGEAVHVAQTIVKADPENAGMLANLALAYLINGQVDEAARAVNGAEALDPEDQAITAAKKRVDDVRSGHLPRPNRIADIVP